MKISLKNLREKKGWSLELASKIFKIKAKTLKDYEEYRKIPDIEEVTRILKILHKNYFNFFSKIYEDIYMNYDD